MKKVLLGGALVFALSFSARADFIPDLVNITGTGPYTWNYMVDLTSDERADPTATNGNTCTGAPCTPPGTFFTIYDFVGYVPGSIAATATGWTASATMTGMTPQNISPTDNSGITNLTFIYTGSVVTGPATFTGFSAQSIYNTGTLGLFSTQATKNVGPAAGTTDRNIGNTMVPVSPVPEPSFLLLLGSSLAALLTWKATARTV